jgi:error-prone DNA polymerase
MSCLPRMKPDHFYDLVVQVAIIRPGPIVGKMVHPYLRRRQGREAVSYPHPALEPVLQRTLGVPLFQEQLLRMAMITAGFSGGEAEELRRAFGFKRSERRMKEIEVKLRRGMTANGIQDSVQDEIIQSITSFALYGFPESHAASFALIAYASAYLKCHYLAAFTAAMLNNQPMGFYSPATLVKDAARHGLKIRPIDVTCSDWECTVESLNSPPKLGGAACAAAQAARAGWFPNRDVQIASFGATPALLATPPNLGGEFLRLRLGLRYVRGLRESAGRALVQERRKSPFTSVEELAIRVPELQKSEMRTLAEIGALNFLNPGQQSHRRDALWQVERAARRTGPLLETIENEESASPLDMMTAEERLIADFHGTGMTTGPHPMAYCRSHLDARCVLRAIDLSGIPNGRRVRVAGCVIARQRPGTAKGFVFLSLEDETGIANIIITPDVLEKNRLTVIQGKFLMIEGPLQNVDNVIHVKAARIEPIVVTHAVPPSRDFH